MVTCPYCKNPARCIDSVEIYHRSYGYIWVCDQCDAYVGCHNGTKVPKGTLANKQLRELRKQAHAAFDPFWKLRRIRTRNECYSWLAERLAIPLNKCHIGEFDEETCKRVIELCRKEIE